MHIPQTIGGLRIIHQGVQRKTIHIPQTIGGLRIIKQGGQRKTIHIPHTIRGIPGVPIIHKQWAKSQTDRYIGTCESIQRAPI